MGRIDELIGAIEAELSADLSVVLDDTAMTRQLRVDRLVELATALSLRSLVDLDGRPGPALASGQSAAGWVASEERIAPGTARYRLVTARRLADRLAATEAAWVGGAVNHEHVKVIAAAAGNLRIGDRVVELQGELIRLAGELSFVHWRQMVTYLVRELDEDGAFDPDAELERNQARFSETLDGSCVLDAHFDRVRYARVEHHVDAKAEELFRHYSHRATISGGELPIPSRSTLRALAIVELIEAGAAADGAPGVAGTHTTIVLTPDHVPPDQPHHRGPHNPDPAGPRHARAGASGDTTRANDTSTTATSDDPPPPPSRSAPAPPPEPPGTGSSSGSGGGEGGGTGPVCGDDGGGGTDVSASADQSTGMSGGGRCGCSGGGPIRGWRAWTLDGLALPGASPDLAALICDATLEALLVDADAGPLALGRSVRLFRPDQRRAIAIRDGGCVFPGCSMPPSACRYHHIEQWHRDRGGTDVATGACLCDRDHGVVHRSGWAMSITADGWTWFRSPTGHTFWGQRHGHQRTGPIPEPGRPPPEPGRAPPVRAPDANEHPPDTTP